MRSLKHLPNVLAALSGIAASNATYACWDEAERMYGVSSELLYAVARAESDLNPRAMNMSHKQRTGTYDIGLMQINSGHLPRLAKHGIGEKDLLEPCTNIKVGAWLLSGYFARHGVSWEAVGAYNAACSTLKGVACTEARSKYAWRVYKRLPGVAATAPDTKRSRVASAPVTAAPQPFILAAKVSSK
jgi:soluble lytic murein transglycosylase-like protein